MTNIFYTRDDKSTRHYVMPGRTSYVNETLCGKVSHEPEPLALPVNCDECRTQLGKEWSKESQKDLEVMAKGEQ